MPAELDQTILRQSHRQSNPQEYCQTALTPPEKQTQELNVSISKMLKEAEDRIESAKSKAVKNIESSAVEITSDIIERFTDKEFKETEVKGAVETAINNIG